MLNDFRYALRQLLKAPAFTLVAVATIALGIGANTAVFSVVSGVLLHPLPYPDADRIVSVFQKMPNFEKASISYPNFLDWQRMNRSFSALAAYRSTSFNVSGQGEPENLRGGMVSAGLFEIFGVKPLLGRTFRAEDDRRGVAPTVMITEGFWRRKFGAKQDVLGRQIVVDGVSRTIIGITPASFRLHIQNFQLGTSPHDLYTPIGGYNEPQFYADRITGWGTDAVGRLKPGVTLEMARQDMARVSRELTTAYPDVNSNKKANLIPLKEEMVGDVRLALLVLLGAVSFVLLISCVNVANLLLTRSTARQREFAIRLAVGAGPGRLIRQLLTESVILAVLGGALGLWLAQFGTVAALAAMPQDMPRAEEIGLDFRVLIFTTLTSLMAGIIFGLAPALKIRQTNLGGALKESGRSVAGSRNRTQRVFVMAEMALALVLLVGAGLMVRTLFALRQLNPGFNAHNVTTFSLHPQSSLAKQSPAAIRAFFRQVHQEIALMPEVAAVSLSEGASLMEGDNDGPIWFAGRPKPAHASDLPMALFYVVEPDYLKTFQIPLRRGRFLAESDDEHSPAVAVIDETMAQKYFRGQDPIGQYLDFDNDPQQPGQLPKVRIVGIVGHVRQWGLDEDATNPLRAQVYTPLAQMQDRDLGSAAREIDFYVRSRGAIALNFEGLRQRLLPLNREMVVSPGTSMEEVVLGSIASRRFTMALLSAFAGLALLLAGIGIYGVLSYFVGQRTPEIGIRMALGAARFDVLRLILMDGARMTFAGIGVGIMAALALTHLMSSLLFGVSPTDWITFLLVIATLCCIALLACYLPARRAMRIDPIIALREE